MARELIPSRRGLKERAEDVDGVSREMKPISNGSRLLNTVAAAAAINMVNNQTGPVVVVFHQWEIL